MRSFKYPSRVYGLACAATLILAANASGQTPPPVPAPPPPPPTLQQAAYADQVARTGSLVTPPGEAFLGVSVDPRYPDRAIVAAVVPGSPAAMVGVLPGDNIVALGNHRVTSPRNLNTLLRAMSPGAIIDLGIQRGRTTTAKVELGYAPKASNNLTARTPTIVR